MRLAFLGLVAGVVMSAAPVTWTLAGVTFADGGVAGGSFVYDATTNAFSSINITTSGGAITGATYTVAAPISGTIFALYVTLPSGNLTGTPALFLVFSSPLTNAGGARTLLLGSAPANSSSEARCSDSVCFGPAAPSRQVTAGSIVGIPQISGVPAPTTWLLMVTGLVFAAFFMRRQRSAAIF
jgi:hypothetical protein